jgi:hypothetical protein
MPTYVQYTPLGLEETVAERPQLDDDFTRSFVTCGGHSIFTKRRELFGRPVRLIGHHNLNGRPNSSDACFQVVDLYYFVVRPNSASAWIHHSR